MSINPHISIRTAESVSPRHPDKLCDRISDAILDAQLAADPEARVAVDVAGGHGTVFITGEISSSASVDMESIVRRIAGSVRVVESCNAQSVEISRGVDIGGAGDQGSMIGYACRETEELMPKEVMLSRSLNQYLYKKWPFDGKTQVTLQNGAIISIVASFQHADYNGLQQEVHDWLHKSGETAGENISFHINPAGDWHLGGFDADAGLTGRKIVVDSYGPRIPVGGGAFSGKDGTKVDRSAAYMARKIAVEYITKHQDAEEVYVQLSYAIGFEQPLEATVTIDGKQQVIDGFDLSPHALISQLDLKKPQFEMAAQYGHFGHGFLWDVPFS